MLYSKLFGKTNKTIKEFESINATLLQKAGFIDQTMAGVYTFLPLGIRVLRKIEDIIREEMDKIGSEVFMPSIVPKQLWEQTGRIDKVDVLMKTGPANEAAKKKNDTEYILNSTHEEVVTPLAQKNNLSYKEFPFAVYQIQTKFRNEPRAKSGLLRCREFRMKDLYSFHRSEAELKEYYEVAKQAYWNVFNKLGIGDKTFVALASGGDFTDDYSHEFQTICDIGEDLIFHAKSKDIAFNREVAPSKAPAVEDTDKEMLPMEDIYGENIIGVDDLVKFMNIPVYKTVKTLIFKTEEDEVIVAAVRGDYEINEEKLRKAAGCKTLELADAETVKKVTGAEVGYAGILNLPKDIRVFIDDAIEPMVNFETGGNRTHYHTKNANWGRDIEKPEKFYDIKMAREGDLYPETSEKYETYKVTEVGNIFPLYDKFTKAFNYKYIDEQGKPQTIYMGCYGIGPSRVMGVLAELFHDEKGLAWPKNVAPFQVQLIGLNLEDEDISQRANDLYEKLQHEGIEVLFDDRRKVSPGEKFGDADLIGNPIRLVISKKTGDKVEFKMRNAAESELLSMEDVIEKARKMLSQ